MANEEALKELLKARKFVLMETHGVYLENGTMINIAHSDKQKCIEHFKENLLYAIRKASIEDNLMGIAISDAES